MSSAQLGRHGFEGIGASRHRTLRQLIHFIDEGPGDGFASGATKTIAGGSFPTAIRWRTADGRLLVEKLITRSGGGATNLTPNPIRWKIYDGVGDLSANVLFTIVDTVTYTNNFESARVRAIVAGDA